MSDVRRRFLREIAERLGEAQVVEVHLFPPLRQSGRETGVAVVAVDPQGAAVAAIGEEGEVTGDAAPGAEDDPADVISPNAGARTGGGDRLTVYRALYRHTLKGMDRGKWELELVAEADAPLPTVDDVVRGVHRRAGEVQEPERLTGEAFRAALVEEPWSASAR